MTTADICPAFLAVALPRLETPITRSTCRLLRPSHSGPMKSRMCRWTLSARGLGGTTQSTASAPANALVTTSVSSIDPCTTSTCSRTREGRREGSRAIEAERLPEASARYYDAIFTATHERLATFLAERCRLSPPTSDRIAHELIGRTVYPRLSRALFGLEKLLIEWPDEASIVTDLDLTPIREAVAALLPPAQSI